LKRFHLNQIKKSTKISKGNFEFTKGKDAMIAVKKKKQKKKKKRKKNKKP